jgi:SAM-dependent methyltransferase
VPLAKIDWGKAYATWGLTIRSLERAYAPSRLLDVLAEFLPRGRGAKVLELGCAPGRWLAWAASTLSVRPLGIDLDREGVRLTRSLYPTLATVRADAFYLPFREGTLDAVYALGVIEHFDDPAPVIAEARRVLKEDGICVFTVPNITPGSVCRWHWATFLPASYAAHRAFTLDELSGLVRQHGFAVVFGEYNGLYVPRCQRIMGRLPVRSLLRRLERPWLAASVVVVGRASGSLGSGRPTSAAP